MNEFVYEHIVHADLDKPLIRQDFGLVMASGDEKANRFRVELTRNGEEVDASGCSVIGYLIRPNDETLRIPGTADGSTVYVDITDHGYVYDGNFTLTIKVYGDGFATAVAIFDGQIAKTTSENIVDGDRVLYGVEDIIAQIDAMEAAEANANAATENANAAATLANEAAKNAEEKAKSADDLANYAATIVLECHSATIAANGAAQGASAASATATSAAEEANTAAGYAIDAAVSTRTATNSANAAANSANAAANSANAAANSANTATTNANAATERANTAASVCENFHPYPVGSIYMSINDTDPAELFGGTWERIQDTFLLAAGSSYSAGSTGGEAAHKLTKKEVAPHTHPYYRAEEKTATISTSGDGETTVVTAITDKTDYSGMQFGDNEAHNNMPPYLAVYVWKRVS